MQTLFLDNWTFYEAPLCKHFSLTNLKAVAEQFQPVEMPHDWLIKDTHNLYRPSEGWYRKEFWLSDCADSVYYFEFDGIYMDSEIYVNGQRELAWKYGYTPLVFSPKHLQQGNNEIVVRVRHEPPNSRWYSGAGIYRNVWLHQLPKVHIPPQGQYVHTELVTREKNEWLLTLRTELKNELDTPQEVTLTHRLFEDNQLIKTSQRLLKIVEDQENIELSMVIEEPHLWSSATPQLYQLETQLMYGEHQEKIRCDVGFRDIQLDSNRGMLVNGQPVKIQGVCQHHDLGALGAVANKPAIERQLKILKDMGVNAIRTAHNPFSKEFYQLADRMGFLVQSEFVDMWKHSKNANDYGRFFEEWVEKDVRAWIKRDRNHPCVFMWSIGNEIYDTHGRDDGIETTKQLIELVKKDDPLHNATISFGSNYMLWENTQRVAEYLEAVGYNYAESIYEEHHRKYPNWVIYGSETASVVQSRGVYHFPLSLSMLADDDFQCSALGNSRTSWGAESIEACIINDRDTPFSLGQFVWSGFDYLGEPTPYNTKNAYLGQIDTAGFPKDAYYTFQAAWTDYQKAPMIHIFPYWDFTEGQVIDVRVCSNAPEIELFFNDKSLGRRLNDPLHGEKLLHDWQLNYTPGELKAVAYNEAGQVIAEDVQKSFGDVQELVVKTGRSELQADGQDRLFVEINGIDENGQIVQNANNDITVEVRGAGRLLGLDNGDSTDYTQYQGCHKRLFNGKLLAIIGSTKESGQIEIICRSKGLPAKKVQFVSNETPLLPGTSNYFATVPYEETERALPVRKVILNKEICSDGRIAVKAKCLPENADDQEVTWRLTDEKGIDTDLGEGIPAGNVFFITPKANGNVTVRCGVKNGKNHLDLYASLPLTFTGLKDSKINPYRPVSGGRYSRSNVQLTNGNERGIATLRQGESWVTFDEVDFGRNGSKLLTLSLFPLESNIFSIDIYEGYPAESTARLIDRVEYTKGSIWNTYQEQSYQLSEKFSGTRTITFVFSQKVHLKEFYFEEEAHDFSQTSILEYDWLYGDSYVVTDTGIKQIGNNVTIGFERFDFGKTGAKGIRIQGNAPDATNSIQIKLTQDGQELRYLLDVQQSNTSQAVSLDFDQCLKGQYSVEFIFLPGSNFNFASFCFY